MIHTIKSLTFWPNGAVLAFDETGEQMWDIQSTGWLELYFDYLLEKGYDPQEIPLIRAKLNDGTWKAVKPFLTEDGRWNYRFEPTEL